MTESSRLNLRDFGLIAPGRDRDPAIELASLIGYTRDRVARKPPAGRLRLPLHVWAEFVAYEADPRNRDGTMGRIIGPLIPPKFCKCWQRHTEDPMIWRAERMLHPLADGRRR